MPLTPDIFSMDPDSGEALGDTFVTITGINFNLPSQGKSIRVFFGAVQCDYAHAVTATRIICRSPRGVLSDGPVDVRVENYELDEDGEEIPGETVDVTYFSAFQYLRPDLSTPGVENLSIISHVTRALVNDLQRYVLRNTYHDMHPEYADVASAAAEPWPETKLATVPNLRVMGPTVEEDRTQALNGEHTVGLVVYEEPVTVMLRFDYIGVGETPAEAAQMLEAFTRYMHATPYLKVTMPDASEHLFEMNPEWKQRGAFKQRTTRQALAQFNGQLRVEGVLVRNINTRNTAKVNETALVDEVIPTYVPQE